MHLLFVNPKEWNAQASQPDHAFITVPVFFAGLTRIDTNAVVQLGNGTVGNDVASKTIDIHGKSITSRYSDSMGNGMLVTKGNEVMVPKGAGRESMSAKTVFEIFNNGRLIVNNTIDALSATSSDGIRVGVAPEIVAWVSANQLDGIRCTGSVEQKGNRSLTLGALSGNANDYRGAQ